MAADTAERASGLTADQEVVREIAKEDETPAASELPEERERSFRFPGFSRMRTEWYGEDGLIMARVHHTVENVIDDLFNDLFAIREELYNLVREPVLDSYGEPQRDRFGWVEWQKTETGNYVEDWSKMNQNQQRRFLFLITTRIFEWEQKKDALWAEAMMAKTQWEEAFSTGWQECEIGKRTEGDRTAAGRLRSQEERYFAIFRTYLSRRGESLVEGMERLAQRIKDIHTA